MINRRISEKKFNQMMARRNILKNIVMRKIIQIRELKKKPKLSDLLSMFRDKSDP
jgi:hypothetical protein